MILISLILCKSEHGKDMVNLVKTWSTQLIEDVHKQYLERGTIFIQYYKDIVLGWTETEYGIKWLIWSRARVVETTENRIIGSVLDRKYLKQ